MKHSNTDGWWAMTDEMLAPPAHRDQCPDCGLTVAAPTARELVLLRASHGPRCPGDPR